MRNDMDEINIVGVVRKLVGQIEPVGESHIDEQRYENLLIMANLVDRLLNDIDAVADEKNRQEYSIRKAGLYADKFMTELSLERGE